MSVIEECYGIKVIYHYTESGHGKGPSDGIGAGIKKKLYGLILGGKVINNVYQTYLALSQKPNEKINQRGVIYVPRKAIFSSLPKKSKAVKIVKGTQSFHMISLHQTDTDVVTCNDLSCLCSVCISNHHGPCFYGQFRNNPQHYHLSTGKSVSPNDLIQHLKNSHILRYIYIVCLPMYLRFVIKQSGQ